MSFFVPEYWPQPTVFSPRVFDYFSKDGPANLRSVFFRMPDGSIIQDDYTGPVWKDRWLLRYDPQRGVVEYGDDYPSKEGYERDILGPFKKMRFTKGKEILWGCVQSIGDSIDVPVLCDPLASTMLPMQALFTKGHQSVYFPGRYDGFKDVLGQEHGDTILCFYQQNWNGGDQVGALYWLERGVGPVQLQWASKYSLVGEPLAAKVS